MEYETTSLKTPLYITGEDGEILANLRKTAKGDIVIEFDHESPVDVLIENIVGKHGTYMRLKARY
jgi:hypothetical protein